MLANTNILALANAIIQAIQQQQAQPLTQPTRVEPTLTNQLTTIQGSVMICVSRLPLRYLAKVNYKGLRAIGEDVPSFTVYLFKAYKAAADEQFCKYIQYK
jgi:hypothetical protein